MDKGKILIRKADAHDLKAIVWLYSRYMFDSHLLRLGSGFVERYLKAIMVSKNSATMIASRDRPVGFIMASAGSRGLQRSLLMDCGILREWIKQAFIHPQLALESLKLARYPFNTGVPGVNAELLFIAIDPAYRNQGLAAALIEEALLFLRAKGIRKVKVSTRTDNLAVNSLLARLGFKAIRNIRLFNKPMYLYTRDI